MYRSISEDLYEYIRRQGAKVIIGEVKRWGDKYYNIASYIDGHGIQHYTKTHIHWTENFVPGRELKLFETPWGKIGITICFDAAFSETWRALALKGAQVIVNISAVPADFPVEYIWRRLAGAAINNQVYVIYANRPGFLFSGHSAIFDPTGACIATTGKRESIVKAEIDLRNVIKWRKQEDIYYSRRPILYREITNRHIESRAVKK